jgi:DNA-binding CsgD family transcriptional regulator
LAKDAVLEDSIASLYEAPLQPTLWQGWLSRLCGAFEAGAGILIAGFEPGRADRNPICFGTTPAHCAELLAEVDRLLAIDPTASTLSAPSDVPAEEFRATRLYREWLRPRHLHHLLVAVAGRLPSHRTVLSLLRQHSQRPFELAEFERVQSLLPHVERAIRLQQALDAASLRHEVADRVLESLRCGAILLDDTGRIRDTNPRAAALLERGEGLEIKGERLQAEAPGERAALRRLVNRAVGADCAGGVLALSRRAPHHALVVSVTPMNGCESRAPWLRGAGALVLLRDPEELPSVSEATLRQLYGLTPAEARVAARVARGETLEEIAESLDVRRPTVRTHLQQTLAKTGTHRQSDLVRLLLMGTEALAEPASPPPSLPGSTEPGIESADAPAPIRAA